MHDGWVGAFDHHPQCDRGKYDQRDDKQQTVDDSAQIAPFGHNLRLRLGLLLPTRYLHACVVA